MTGALPSATVVISTYNDRRYVDRCVETLIEVRHPSLDIVFVNDGSTDDTSQRLGHWQERGAPIRVIDLPENLGMAGARNAGIRGSTGEIVVFTDTDCRFPPGWLEELLAPFADPSVSCAGGPDQSPPDEPFVARCIDFTITSGIATGGLRRGSTPLARYSPSGCNLAIRRRVLDEVGLFDERLRRRGEDKELSQRMRRAGQRPVYVPEAMLLHHRRPSLLGFWRQTFASGGARHDILSIAPDATEPAHLVPGILTLALLGCLVLAVGAPSLIWPRVVLGGYALVVSANGLLGGVRMRSARAIPVIILSTAMVHIAYGAGFLHRALTTPLRRRVRQRTP